MARYGKVGTRTTLQDMYAREMYIEIHSKSEGLLKEGTKESKEEYILGSVVREVLNGTGKIYNLEYLLRILEEYAEIVSYKILSPKDKMHLSRGMGVGDVLDKIESRLEKDLDDAYELLHKADRVTSMVAEYIKPEGEEEDAEIKTTSHEVFAVEVFGMMLEKRVQEALKEQGESRKVSPEIPRKHGYGVVTKGTEEEYERVFENVLKERGYQLERGKEIYAYYKGYAEGMVIQEGLEEIDKELKKENVGIDEGALEWMYVEKVKEMLFYYLVTHLNKTVLTKVMKEVYKEVQEKNRESVEIERGYKRELRGREKAEKQLEEVLQRVAEQERKLKETEAEIKNKDKTSQGIEEKERELEEIKEKEKQKEKELKELEDEVTKGRSRFGSYEKRISNLEKRLENYANIENDLMEISVENTNLKSDIEELARVEEEPEDKHAARVERLKNKRVLLIGGIGAGIEERLQKDIPNLKHIDVGDTGVNFRTSNQHDIVVIFTRVVSHSHVMRVKKEVGTSTPVVAVNFINNRLIVKEIDRIMHGTEE